MGSLFWKIFTWFWVAMITIGTAVGWGVKLYIEYTQQDHRHQLPKVKVEAISHAIEQSGRDGAIELLESFNKHSGFPVFIITDDHKDILGRLLPHHLLNSPHKPDPGFRIIRKQATTPQGEVLKIVAPVSRHSRAINWHRGYSRIIATIIALFISALVCFWLARYITSPVKKLSQASRKLAEGDLDVRVEEKCRRKDEITELSDDFNQMAERLQTLIHAQGQLFSDISHELRSPLARLQVAVALAQKDIESNRNAIASLMDADPGFQEAFQRGQDRLIRIQKDIDRMEQLVGQVLALSRLETSPQLNLDGFLNIAELVSAIVSDVQVEAQAKDCNIRFSPMAHPPINGDQELLHRAIENIIRNAVYYTETETEISVSLSSREQQLFIRVCDQGPGVEEPHLETIFEPFIRTDEARERNTGGYGLGMAIAKRATLAHGGTIRAFANKPTGLCVEIALPLSPPDAREALNKSR